MTATDSRSSLEGVDVRSVMAHGLVACPPCAALIEAAVLMSIHQVHAVVVDPGAPRLVTAPEVLRALLAGGQSVAEIAPGETPSVAPEVTLHDAASLMAAQGEGHLVVREHGAGQARGIVSSFDVVAVIAGHDPRVARIVRPAAARPALSGPMESHRVRDVMHRGIVGCSPGAPLSEIAAALVERRTHSALVTLGGGRAFVTDMDIVAAIVRGEAGATAAEIASHGVAAVQADAPLAVAGPIVAESPAGHVVAVEADGFPVGVVSTLDLLGAVDPS